MKFFSTIGQSLRSIFGNPVRSTLTVLGIVIGIAAVIAVVGLGKGLQNTVSSNLSSLNANQITVTSQDPNQPTAERGGGRSGGGPGGFRFSNTAPTITAGDLAAIQKLPNVAAVSPNGSKQLDVTTKPNASQATGYDVLGTSAQYPSIQNLTVASGAWMTAPQVASGADVVVLGSTAAVQLFPSGSPVGKTIYIAGKPLKVIGTLANVDDAADPRSDPNQSLFTGYVRWAKLSANTAYPSLLVTGSTEDQVPALATSITSLLQTRHETAAGANPDVSVVTASEVLKARSQITNGFTTTLAAIAAISLLVGGIGIMNIMLVTVTERTREIGLRRAVGAKARNILAQFLTEAVMLTLMGGIIGLALGYVLGGAVGGLLTSVPGSRGQSVAVVLDPSVALLAVSIAVVVGVIFGLFPAIRAARLDPATALRHE
ncbi:MAG: ABC transporter permease [Candidatus Nanopelagicales bacterium]